MDNCSPFLITSIIHTIIAANEAGNQSILDNNDINEVEVEQPKGTPGLD